MTQAQRRRAQRIRAAQDIVMQYVNTDAAAVVNEIAVLIREWTPEQYAIGDVRMYGGIPRRCVQAHDATVDPENRTPEVASLWMEYHGTSIETARPYKPVTGAHDVYNRDEYAIWTDGKVYRCKTNATAYSPGELPQNWEVVGSNAGNDNGNELTGEPAGEPGDEWPEWVRPTGAHDTYPLGAQMTYGGQRYTSLIAGNGWSPDEYAAGWLAVGVSA